jgi:hypothetical protein
VFSYVEELHLPGTKRKQRIKSQTSKLVTDPTTPFICFSSLPRSVLNLSFCQGSNIFSDLWFSFHFHMLISFPYIQMTGLDTLFCYSTYLNLLPHCNCHYISAHRFNWPDFLSVNWTDTRVNLHKAVICKFSFNGIVCFLRSVRVFMSRLLCSSSISFNHKFIILSRTDYYIIHPHTHTHTHTNYTFSSPRSDWLCGPPSQLSNAVVFNGGYAYPQGYAKTS